LLWQARFPEGHESHTAWVNRFEESLSAPLKRPWFDAVRATTPALVPATQSDAPVHGVAAEATPETQATSVIARSKRGRPASPPSPRNVSVNHRSPSRSKREARAQTLPLCVICQEVPLKLKISSLCGHFACEGCWRQWFKQCFECPVCRKRVRPTNLIRMRGWGDD
jgi:hypothetical protein